MLLYYLLIGIALLGKFLYKRFPQGRHLFLLTAGIGFWLLASFRYVIGFDYRFYETIFQSISDFGGSSLFEMKWIEPGYQLLCLAVSHLGGDYRIFLFVFHLLCTALVFAWIDRWSPAPWLSIYLFVTLQYFAMSMNFLRQAFAAAILLWTYPFLKSRRFLPCLGIILLAASFHRTALIMLPLYFLLTLRPSRIHYGIAAAAAGITYFSMDSIIGLILHFVPKYQHYLTEKYWQGNSILYALMPVGCFLFALPLLQQARKDENTSPVLANSMFYSLLIQIFILKHFILERFSIYTAFFSLLALPESVNAPCRIPRKLRTGILVVGSFLYFLFAASQGFHGVYPYKGIWDKAIS